ncbi:T9SS type A sorting domain-containing protein, partial [Winogradskyella sp.]
IGINSGHVRIFKNLNGLWIQIGQDIDGEEAGGLSGSSVSLSADGSIVAIGAPYNDGNGVRSGHVRVYENISDVWTQIGQDIDGEDDFNESGCAVSLSSDGNRVAIGAWLNSNNNANELNSGHVRVYENVSGIWTQIGQDIDGEVGGDKLGYSISLSSDGDILAAGAIHNDDIGFQSGQVRVYQYESGLWTQIGQDINGLEEDEKFGFKVSLSSDGSIVAASTIEGDVTSPGFVRIYRNVSGIWTQIGSDLYGDAEGDQFGYSISLSNDGNLIAIGANENDESGVDSGQVKIFKNINDVWVQIGQEINGEAGNDNSGHSLSLSSDGSSVVVGAIFNDGNGNDSGHVRVYDLSALLSVEEETISNFKIHPNPTKNQLTIQLNNSFDLQNVNIYNNLGQLVLTSKESIIDVSKLALGLYTVEIETNQGKGTQKLIVE